MSKRRVTDLPSLALAFVLVGSALFVGPAASAGVCASTAAGQLARWPGDASAAEVAHGRDGTLIGGTTFVPGKVDQAFSFDGVNNTVTVPDDPDWSLAGDFTIDTWVNFAGFHGHAQALVAQDEGFGTTSKWMFWYAEGGALAFEFGTHGLGFIPVSAGWSPTISQWYHVAVTRSGSDFTLYINGVVVDTGTETASIADGAAPLTLGWGETDWFLDGLLDEPAIYLRALSGAEIKAIYDAGSSTRCAITQSALTLTSPAWAYPNQTLTVDGTLALSGGASVDGLPIEITKSVDGAAPVAVATPAAAADGSFSFEDTPAAGTVVYRAAFAGATNTSAENAFATVVVAKRASKLTVSVSKSTVRYGDKVTITAHLNGGSQNKTVTIWAVPAGGTKQKLRQAEVNGSGNLSVPHAPTRNTTYYATYGGDAYWEADTSASKVVEVVPRWSTKIIGGYATVHGVRLYHYSSKCGPTDATGCPAATFTLGPNHAGQRVSYQGRYCKNGNCVDDSGTYRLNSKSKVYVYIYYGDSSAIGWTINFRYRFLSDKDHNSSTSDWVKTKITS